MSDTVSLVSRAGLPPGEGTKVYPRRRESGQVLVLVVLALIAMLSAVALIIDGGNAFAQQRVAQNAADAASEAGAVVLMKKLAGVPGQDGDAVYNAVVASATVNGLQTLGGATVVAGCYTDIAGAPLDSFGNQVADCASAAQIGVGLPIPPCASCPGSSAAGVHVGGDREFSTFVAGVIGLPSFTASAEATAIAGYVTALAGQVIPLTFPTLATGCDGTGGAVPGTSQWPVRMKLSVPLCGNSPGNVGWLDWTPTAGGASELAGAILGNPPNPAITTPRWYYVTSTGNVNSGQVQTSMDFWNGQQIHLPIFGATCNSAPLNNTVTPGSINDCVAGGGSLGGNGQNQWYFLVGFAAFDLEQSFINGNDGGLCEVWRWAVGTTGNGGTSCLIGQFADSPAVSLGAAVGAGGGSANPSSPLGVQLIR